MSYSQLRQHLTDVHSVAQDCVDKLISTVSVCKVCICCICVCQGRKENEKEVKEMGGMGQNKMSGDNSIKKAPERKAALF